MDDAPLPLVLATLLAVLAGGVGALRRTIPALVVRFDLIDPTPGTLSAIIVVAGLIALALSPIGTFVAGYLWGTRADVRSGYLRLAGFTGVGAVLAYVVVTVLVFLAMATAGHQNLLNLLGGVVYSLSALTVPFSALGGAAIAHFRSGDAGSGRPHGTATDDAADRDPSVEDPDREFAVE